MKLGFLTDDPRDVGKATRLGFDAIELSSSAFGDPRMGPLDQLEVERARELAYYGLASFDVPAEEDLIRSYGHVFDAAVSLGVRVVATMSGFDADLDWEGNLELFGRRFGALATRAADRGLVLAVENWVGFWGHLPYRPINMGGSPETWERWFDEVPSPALGIEFDPSHLLWQGIDPVRALRDFSERVYSVHAKDVETDADLRYRRGVNGDTFRFRVPGFGEVDWASMAAVLAGTGYEGGVVIEHEDETFGYRPSGRDEALYDEGLERGARFLAPLLSQAAVR
jgi:sugar phosphate isomerase/epimerase